MFIDNDHDYFAEDAPIFTEEVFTYFNIVNSELGPVPSSWVRNEDTTKVSLILNWSDAMKCNDDGTSKYSVYTNEYRNLDPNVPNESNCGMANLYFPL